jgi:hypothetical protein
MSTILATKTYDDDDSSRSFVSDIPMEKDLETKLDEGSSSQSEAEEESDADEPLAMPESLKRIFAEDGVLRDYTKSENEKELAKHSLFTKVSKKVDSKTTSGNL